MGRLAGTRRRTKDSTQVSGAAALNSVTGLTDVGEVTTVARAMGSK